MGERIVCAANVDRYYGDNAALLAKYAEIARSNECPFCAPNIENPFVGQTQGWNIVHNQFPYKYADGTTVRLHLLLLPKRHVLTFAELDGSEMADLGDAIRLAKVKYPFLVNGCGMGVRELEVGGVTLYHLHWHLIAPQIGPKGQIPINFGIG